MHTWCQRDGEHCAGPDASQIEEHREFAAAVVAQLLHVARDLNPLGTPDMLLINGRNVGELLLNARSGANLAQLAEEASRGNFRTFSDQTTAVPAGTVCALTGHGAGFSWSMTYRSPSRLCNAATLVRRSIKRICEAILNADGQDLPADADSILASSFPVLAIDSEAKAQRVIAEFNAGVEDVLGLIIRYRNNARLSEMPWFLQKFAARDYPRAKTPNELFLAVCAKGGKAGGPVRAAIIGRVAELRAAKAHRAVFPNAPPLDAAAARAAGATLRLASGGYLNTPPSTREAWESMEEDAHANRANGAEVCVGFATQRSTCVCPALC